MRIGIRKAHTKNCYGAKSYLDEWVESRNIVPKVIELLSAYHTIVDCTPNESLGWGEWNTGVNTANNSNLDLFFSIHFNSGNGDPQGTEVCIYPTDNIARNYGNKICENMKSLGFKNRGVKDRTDLAETVNIKCPSMIIETCFVQESDGKLYKQVGIEKIARAIANAIEPKITLIAQTNINTNELYRIRKSWTDVASQKGAYSNLTNAINECKKYSNYKVFDNNGKQVYPEIISITDDEMITSSYKENGKATLIIDKLNVRDFPNSKTGKVVATYTKNESFYYNEVYISNSYIWVSYISNSGYKRYVAVKDKKTGQRYANCI